ncbi:MAG: mini-ribonuclease [Pseudothermotoga sp.]|nr:MAG: Mini-ribonuclease 3 [Pseudothermotoga lettingae]MDI3494837.1 mini-ribonuclease [Pseudothermotoga sp.]
MKLHSENMQEGEILDVSQIPISTMAYIGDAIYSLYCKVKSLKLMKVKAIHKEVNKIISREGQARSFDRLVELLSAEEFSLVKRALNSRAAKKYGNDIFYRKSTALEALIGYLYLKGNKERLIDLLKIAVENDKDDRLW